MNDQNPEVILKVTNFSRVALILSGAITFSFYKEYSTSSEAYYIGSIFTLVVIAWFFVEIKLSTATAPRQKRSINLFLVGICGLCSSIVSDPDFQLANKNAELVEIKNRVIQTDFSSYDVPETEWAAITKKESDIKQRDLLRNRYEVKLLQTYQGQTNDFSIALAVFSGLLIFHSLLRFKPSKREDDEEVEHRRKDKLDRQALEKAEELERQRLRRQKSNDAFIASLNKMEPEKELANRERENLIDEICCDLDAMKMPEEDSPPENDLNKGSINSI